MLEFVKTEDQLLLRYEPELNGARWVTEELKTHGEVVISRVLTLYREDIIECLPASSGEDDFEVELDGEIFVFVVGRLEGGYFRIPGRILGIESDVLISASGVPISRKTFIAHRNVSIFRNLSKVVPSETEVVIGGDREDSIPAEVFAELLEKFPNSTELDRYARARVANIISEYFEGMRDFRTLYEEYLSKRKSVIRSETLSTPDLLQSEIDKYVLIRDTIQAWLEGEDAHTEKEWQALILNFILLIFPKYVGCFKM